MTDYKRIMGRMLPMIGKEKVVTELRAEDFSDLRTKMAEGHGLVTLTSELQRVKTLFKFAYDHEYVDNPVRVSVHLKAPSKKSKQEQRNAQNARMFEAAELRETLAAGGLQLRAMILLDINCGYGQSDISCLPETAVNLPSGWIDFPRPKTAIPRRSPLWPETITALREAFQRRPTAKETDAVGCAFVTKYGSRYVGQSATAAGTFIDSIGLEFGKLLRRLGLKGLKDRRNFYAIRHTFQTVGDEAKDPIAVNFLMGHAHDSADMSSVYRERTGDKRLLEVTNHVRLWLWPEGSEAAWLAAEAERLKAAEST